jgi:arsenate reductase-like glutaredoxin family protein
MNDINKIYHDIKSRCSSIKNAVDLLKDVNIDEKKEILSLMKKSVFELQKSIEILEKEITKNLQ